MADSPGGGLPYIISDLVQTKTNDIMADILKQMSNWVIEGKLLVIKFLPYTS